MCEFPQVAQLLIFYFIPLWFQNRCCAISVLLNVSRLFYVLRPTIWSVLENVLGALGSAVCSVVGWSVLSVSVRLVGYGVVHVFCFLVGLLSS